jgi:hypothetical protein
MKIDKKNIVGLIELLEEAENFRPLVRKFIDTIKSYGPEIDEILDTFLRKARSSKVDDIRFYLNNGFSEEEAILLTLDTRIAIKESLEKASKNYK